MAVCRACKQLIEDGRLLCPHCYAAQKNTRSAARRPQTIVAFLIVLAAIALTLRLIVYRFF